MDTPPLVPLGTLFIGHTINRHITNFSLFISSSFAFRFCMPDTNNTLPTSLAHVSTAAPAIEPNIARSNILVCVLAGRKKRYFSNISQIFRTNSNRKPRVKRQNRLWTTQKCRLFPIPTQVDLNFLNFYQRTLGELFLDLKLLNFFPRAIKVSVLSTQKSS